MKKWSRLDPDHFLSLASPCPRSLILQQLNIFRVFFMRLLGLVGLLANMLVGRSRFETDWVIVLCTCSKYFLCGLHNMCHHIMARSNLFILSLSLSLSTQNWVQVSANCQRKQLKCRGVTCNGLAFHSGRE